jgi:cell division septation protein DedD
VASGIDDRDADADDGVREIQLSGKQLVFVFMATTVVAVVIFLCGVMVGLGVRPERSEAASLGGDQATPAQGGEPAPTSAPAPPAGTDDLKLTAASDLTRAEPAPVQERATAPAVASPAPSRSPSPVPSASPSPSAPPSPRSTPAPAPSVAAGAEVQPGDYTVQVAGLRERSAAEAMVKRLMGKGYAAFIVDPVVGAPAPVYRVRVGRYPSRAEAEDVARRLEREERFKPFVTR